MRKKWRFSFYLTEIRKMVWGSHYIYICARWEIINGIAFMGSGISVGDALLWQIYGSNEGSATIRYNTEWRYQWVCMCPSACGDGQNLNTDLTEDTDLAFHWFLRWLWMGIGLFWGFSWICECWGTPFPSWVLSWWFLDKNLDKPMVDPLAELI